MGGGRMFRCSVAPYPLSLHFPFPPPGGGIGVVQYRMKYQYEFVIAWFLLFLVFGNGIAGNELELDRENVSPRVTDKVKSGDLIHK
ncbi:hypothetical protein Tco_0799650 [Tanacetum coccineum]|uniref:Uncharacterized protein n=1 Tax=Tanacetum coccineum TaxID=301880 RepID=A0ABQ4ZUS9_9ASTR